MQWQLSPVADITRQVMLNRSSSASGIFLPNELIDGARSVMTGSGPFLPVGERQLLGEHQPNSRFVP